MFKYSEYNPYTLTGRPSNHYDGINYAALNKTNGDRKRFVSRHESKGGLLEVDLKGFHLFLLYMICELSFPDDVYTELSKYYPVGVNPKEYTFKQIYGGVDRDLLGYEPFYSINALSKSIYAKFMQGTLKTLLFERPVTIEMVEGSNQSKIFNYMLQNLETEFNSLLLEELLEGLKGMKTRLVLYTYDSFLFDVHSDEIDSLIFLIKEVFRDIPHKTKIGKNYQDLKTIII